MEEKIKTGGLKKKGPLVKKATEVLIINYVRFRNLTQLPMKCKKNSKPKVRNLNEWDLW